MVELHLSMNSEADELLSKSPLALLIGMVLDQQVPLEWAFAAPAELRRRLGGKLDTKAIAAMDPEELTAAFVAKPALHRYPAAMAARVHDLCVLLVEQYGGKAERVWAEVATGQELISRLRQLPGFGEQKAKIFAALLGKQLSVRPDGWQEASAPFGDPGSFRSAADIVSDDTLVKVRVFKQELKAAHRAAKAGDAQPAKRGTAASGGRPAKQPAGAAKQTGRR